MYKVPNDWKEEYTKAKNELDFREMNIKNWPAGLKKHISLDFPFESTQVNGFAIGPYFGEMGMDYIINACRKFTTMKLFGIAQGHKCNEKCNLKQIDLHMYRCETTNTIHFCGEYCAFSTCKSKTSGQEVCELTGTVTRIVIGDEKEVVFVEGNEVAAKDRVIKPQTVSQAHIENITGPSEVMILALAKRACPPGGKILKKMRVLAKQTTILYRFLRRWLQEHKITYKFDIDQLLFWMVISIRAGEFNRNRTVIAADPSTTRWDNLNPTVTISKPGVVGTIKTTYCRSKVTPITKLIKKVFDRYDKDFIPFNLIKV